MLFYLADVRVSYCLGHLIFNRQSQKSISDLFIIERDSNGFFRALFDFLKNSSTGLKTPHFLSYVWSPSAVGRSGY